MTRRFKLRALLALTLLGGLAPFVPAVVGARPVRGGCAAACRRHLATCPGIAGHVGRHFCPRGCTWF
jgi:hypothetical protein